MAKSESEVCNEHVEKEFTEDEDSSTECCVTDDSEDDPTYDILEKTRSSLSKMSLKKSKSRTSKVKDSTGKTKLDFEEVKMAELDEVDAKSFENVEKIIQAGQLEKLKIDQCKVYLRKHGLRLTGNKDVLIERIREHLGIINGGGEQKYPASTFVLNCKGDACTGDVVMFEQNVYEMYNVASRSATGPPCGTRIVAGRIVKESYGAAKQQHTFTIEVLWSKGMKPLPPLHPLLIKGRNLYRLKTLRQKWTDEVERSRVLLEKHSRGSLARSSRETRVQKKEMRKVLREQRGTRINTIHKENQHPQPNPVQPNNCRQETIQTQNPHKPVDSAIQPNRILTQINEQRNSRTQPNLIKPQMNNIPGWQTSSVNLIKIQISNASQRWWGNITEVDKHENTAKDHHKQPATSNVASRNPLQSPSRQHVDIAKDHQSYAQSYPSLNSPPRSPLHHFPRKDQSGHIQNNPNGYVHKQPLASSDIPHRSPMREPAHIANDHQSYVQSYPSLNCRPQSPLHHLSNKDQLGHIQKNDYVRGQPLPSSPPRSPLRAPTLQQQCRFYAQGRCTYGDTCKFLHEYRREQSLHVPPRSPLRHFPGRDNPCPVQQYRSGYIHKQPSSSLTSPPRSPMRQQVCHYFPDGNCRRGNYCKFLHVNRREQR
ncbi:hypothetical protein AQUCO_07600023v1 [Aquilegia coerulea]|uniref:C3H1-type domain-containing protein n=1 Tax=Aquilegia coerulea TaxID=218851 RepID=A0A2G5C8F7_AQUCA|nr:hypothetical protein AQUCO_07600023v1 [Aquilegia coerulea]